MSIHVSPSLDLNQRIFRAISFFDLVELTTYGRLPFRQAARFRLASLRSRLRGPHMPATVTSDLPMPTTNGMPIQASSASTAVVCESWSLASPERLIDTPCDDASAPSIHIVSTIHALAESLFVSEGMEGFIDHPTPFVHAAQSWHPTHAGAMPIVDDGALTVTLWPRRHAAGQDQPLTTRLPVDLRTLLTRVLVSPKAPTRFIDLVSNLVHRVSHAHVSRANSSLESTPRGLRKLEAPVASIQKSLRPGPG